MEPLAGFLAPAAAQVRPELTGKTGVAPNVSAGLFQGILTDLLLLGTTGESPPNGGELLPGEPQPGAAKGPGLALLLSGAVLPPTPPATAPEGGAQALTPTPTPTPTPPPIPEEAPESQPAEGEAVVAVETMAALTAVVAPQAPVQATAQSQPAPGPANTAPVTAAPVEVGLAQTSSLAEARFVARAVQSLTATAAPEDTEQPVTDPSAPKFETLVRLMTEAEGDGAVPAKPQAQARAETPTRHAAPATPIQAETPQAPTQASKPAPQAAAVAELSPKPTAPEPAPAPEPIAPDQPPPLATPGPTELRSDLPVGMEPAAEPRPPVEPEMVTRQVTRFVKVMLDGETAEARLMLHPKHLGAVAVKLVINEGAVKAHLTVSDQAVKAALDANLDMLRTRFADQGFRVEQVQVSVGSDSQLGGQQPQQHQQHQQSHQGHRSGRPAYAAEANAQPEPETPTQPRIWTPGSTGRRLNSLV